MPKSNSHSIVIQDYSLKIKRNPVPADCTTVFIGSKEDCENIIAQSSDSLIDMYTPEELSTMFNSEVL